jgi:hypothetical protein
LHNTPAGLDPSGLQDNGGSTQTIGLLSSSAAVDKIPTPCSNADGHSVPTDQRGDTRPQGTNCDIGAFELQVSSGIVVTNTDDSGTARCAMPSQMRRLGTRLLSILIVSGCGGTVDAQQEENR